jgi:hypothetical protein
MLGSVGLWQIWFDLTDLKYDGRYIWRILPFFLGPMGKIFFQILSKIKIRIVLDSCLLGEYEYVY